MSNVNWTKAQEHAISFSGNNLLVSAAAGSGKTAVMVQRIINMILSKKSSVDSMLVVTFTNAAAASMKQKISDALDKAIDESDDEELRNYLFRQRSLVSRADISTIHSFCIHLLKKYYYKTPLSPDFKLINPTQQAILKQKAIEEVIEEASKRYEDGLFDDYGKFYSAFITDRSDKEIEQMIFSLYKFLCIVPEKHAYIEDVKNSFEFPDRWKKLILDYYKEKVDILYEYIDEICENFKNSFPNKIDIWKDKLHDYFNVVKFAEDLDSVIAQLAGKDKKRFDFTFKLKKSEENLAAEKDELTICEEPIKKFQASMVKTLKKIVPDSEHSKAFCNVLFDLEARFFEKYNNLLIEAGSATYETLLLHTVNLLNENDDILECIRNEYSNIFVDEYQDVNEMLNYIVEKISRGNNLFFVGDVKQSIYGFNNSKPELFLNKYESYKDDVSGHTAFLSENFRSCSRVIDGINFIFSNLMTRRDTDIEYDQKSMLHTGMDSQLSDGMKDCNCNELIACFGSDVDEYKMIANRIKSLIGQKVICNGKEITLEYKHIAVLAQTNKQLTVISNILNAQNVPATVDSSKGSDSADELVLMSLLNVLDIKLNDIDLISVMLSCIGGFTPNELAIIKSETDDDYYWNRLKAFNAESVLKAKIDDFTKLIEKYSLLVKTMPLAEFIEYVYNQTGYIYRIASLDNGIEHLAKIDKFIACARDFSNNIGGTLRDFITYYTSYVEGDSSTSSAVIDPNEQCVHCMTIHKSKGLEFPVVILAATTQKLLNSKRYSSKMLISDRGLSFKRFEKSKDGKEAFLQTYSFAYSTIMNDEALKKEYIRLLYVALTRAVSMVIVSASFKPGTGKNANSTDSIKKYLCPHNRLNYVNFNCFFDLIAPLITYHRDGEELRLYGNISSPKYLQDTSRWTVRIFEQLEENFSQFDPSVAETNDLYEDSFTEKLKKSLNWEYAYRQSTTERAKINPSKAHSIQANSNNHGKSDLPSLHEPMLLRKPEFSDIEYKASQKGTIVHFFMEHIDFYSGENAKMQADKMLLSGIISKDEYDTIPFKQIDAFLACDLGKRLSKSSKICRERPFCKTVPFGEDNKLIQGIIDCYFFEDNNITIIDYKTDVIRGTVNEQAQKHRQQLLYYADALSLIYPDCTVTPYVYFFTVDKFVKIQ